MVQPHTILKFKSYERRTKHVRSAGPGHQLRAGYMDYVRGSRSNLA